MTSNEIYSRRLLTTGELFHAARALKYQQIRRACPDASEDEVRTRLGQWMQGVRDVEHRAIAGVVTERSRPPLRGSRLLSVLERTRDDLATLEQASALVGALAVSTWVDVRFGRDIDFAVAVSDNAAAESLVSALGERGYVAVPEETGRVDGRLIFARLVPGDEDPEAGMVVDLLFASSGIEREIVMAAEEVEIAPGLHARVARPGHLIAMKVLASRRHRSQDADDIERLLRNISSPELDRAREAIALIEARGFNRGKALNAVLDDFLNS